MAIPHDSTSHRRIRALAPARRLIGRLACAAALPALAFASAAALNAQFTVLPSQFVQVAGVGSEAHDTAAVLANLDSNPRPELLFFVADNPNTPDTIRYRVIPNVDANGTGTTVNPYIEIPGLGEAEGIGAAITQLDTDPRPDLVVMTQVALTATVRWVWWKVGLNLNAAGVATSWSGPFQTSLTNEEAEGCGLAIGNIDGDRRPDMVLMSYAKGSGSPWIRYRVGWNLGATGVPATWGPVWSLAGMGATAQGADLELANLDGDSRPELIFLTYENLPGANVFRYRVAWNLNASGAAASFGNPIEVAGCGTEGQGAGIAAAQLGGGTSPEILLMAYDNPAGQNSFRYKVLQEGNPATTYPAADLTGSWVPLGISTRAGGAAVGGGDNGFVYVMAIGTNGVAYTRRAKTPTAYESAQAIGGGPSSGMNTYTQPVLIRDGGQLYGFARGTDDNLWRTTLTVSGFSSWQPVTSTGRIGGRFELAFSRTTSGGAPVLHAVYQTPTNSPEYGRWENWQLVATRPYGRALDGTLGTDGKGQVCVVARYDDKLVLDCAAALDGWRFYLLTNQIPSGIGIGNMFDVANVVFYEGAWHLLYSHRYRDSDINPNYTYELTHSSYRVGFVHPRTARPVARYTPAGGTDVKARLVNYRNKLVAAYALTTGQLYFARWDNADPSLPWIDMGSAGAAHGRPSIASVDFRHGLLGYDFPNWGFDLFGAIQGNAATADTYFSPLSRMLMKREMASQFAIYNSQSDTLDPVCRDQTDPWGPHPVDWSQEQRPLVPELGMNLWMLPSWFTRGFYQRVATRMCNTGNGAASGRFGPPCGANRMAIIIKQTGGIFFCAGNWVNSSGNQMRMFEELGHYLSSNMGFQDTSYRPTAEDAAICNIPLSTLQAGRDLFAQRVGQCGNCPGRYPTGRCPGFTGIANNYDCGSVQHSWIYAMYYYLNDGDLLREFIAQDLARGDTLLNQKYQWIRNTFFGGIEFRGAFEPIPFGQLAPFGAGCLGSNGYPTQIATPDGTHPNPSQGTTYNLTSGPRSSLVWLGFGTSTTTWNGLPLPFDLTPLGAPGCKLLTDNVALIGANTDSNGRANVRIPGFTSPSTIGLSTFTQFVCLDPSGNPMGLTVSNGVMTQQGGLR